MDQICYCRKVGKITTSWTDSNPGRRFIGCEQYGHEGACGYFAWIDPPMCARSKVVIPGLLRSIGRHEAEKKMLKKKNTWLVVAFAMSWCLFGCLVLYVLAY